MSRRRENVTPAAEPAPPKVVRCAAYTRKSTEEGLQQAFNTLDAQREVEAATTGEDERNVSGEDKEGVIEDAEVAGGASEGVAIDNGDDEAGGADNDDIDFGPAARAELARVRAHAGVLLDIVLRIVDRRGRKHRAVSLLSAWEGFGRFTRECCGVEPLTMLRAWRLLAEDPGSEARRLYPKAKVDEEQAANWHASLAGAWARHTAALCVK